MEFFLNLYILTSLLTNLLLMDSCIFLTGQFTTDKLRNLVNNRTKYQVVNVSRWDPITGKGARRCKLPGPKSKCAGYKYTEIPIVSNDLNKYIKALIYLYGPDAERKYEKEIKVVEKRLLVLEELEEQVEVRD